MESIDGLQIGSDDQVVLINILNADHELLAQFRFRPDIADLIVDDLKKAISDVRKNTT